MVTRLIDFSTTMIKAMDLPKGWQETQTLDGDSFHFQPHGVPDVLLAVFSRHVSYFDHLAICRVISFGEHTISVQELEMLAPVLGNMSDPDVFSMRLALVLELRGKPVIAVEGTYKANGHRCRSLFVASSANTIEVIYFQAPGGLFAEYEGAADHAFKSILWRH